ncbi:hypothetical protein JYU34_015256 [Plutella xylostella]|uniref:Uncharacterized protein n=1 Tax=Plutella xylostella TaxID=51655 RepID=A0ABQ7Q6P3_PLUXY|nr:hypothetical protein JYU34_015256 [Plutella xylostella]
MGTSLHRCLVHKCTLYRRDQNHFYSDPLWCFSPDAAEEAGGCGGSAGACGGGAGRGGTRTVGTCARAGAATPAPGVRNLGT